MRSLRQVGALCVALAVVQLPRPAAAYRTLADDDPELAGRVGWATASVPLSLHDVVPRDVLVTDAHRALQLASAAWSSWQCSALQVPSVTVTATGAVPRDGSFVVDTLRSAWRDLGFPADVAATTDLIVERTEDGRWVISSADILVNDLDYQWAATPQPADGSRRDLRSVLTHELGHGLGGLAHPCEHGASGAPDCTSSPSFADTTMFPDYLGDSQSSLAEDDIRGICFIYPAEGCADLRCAEDAVCVAGECHVLCAGVICPSAHSCEAGACAPVPCDDATCPHPRDECDPGGEICGDARPGDPCTIAEECSTGLCSAAGYCVGGCGAAGECPARHTCIDGGCEPDAAPFGATCAEPSECASRLCLDTGAEAYCTRACDPAGPCPAAHACTAVEGQSVCAPVRAGCAVAAGATEHAVLGAMSAPFLALISRRRRRRRRRGARS